MKLNQSEFAKLLGVSRNYLSMIETGREPSDALQKLFARIEADHRRGKLPTESAISGAVREDSPVYGARARLRAARQAAGLSVPELARMVGYSVATYQEIEEGRSQMGEKMAHRVAEVLQVPVADLIGGGDHPPERGATNGTFGTAPELIMGPGMEGRRAKFVPLLSMAQCGDMMAYDDGAYDHGGFVCYDPQDSQAFAVKLAGDSMMPRFEAGDVAVVYPSKQPRNGSVVIAKLKDESGGDVMLKLYNAAQGQVTLTSYNPAYPPMTWPAEAFAWIYPVAQVTKVLT